MPSSSSKSISIYTRRSHPSACGGARATYDFGRRREDKTRQETSPCSMLKESTVPSRPAASMESRARRLIDVFWLERASPRPPRPGRRTTSWARLCSPRLPPPPSGGHKAERRTVAGEIENACREKGRWTPRHLPGGVGPVGLRSWKGWGRCPQSSRSGWRCVLGGGRGRGRLRWRTRSGRRLWARGRRGCGAPSVADPERRRSASTAQAARTGTQDNIPRQTAFTTALSASVRWSQGRKENCGGEIQNACREKGSGTGIREKGRRLIVTCHCQQGAWNQVESWLPSYLDWTYEQLRRNWTGRRPPASSSPRDLDWTSGAVAASPGRGCSAAGWANAAPGWPNAKWNGRAGHGEPATGQGSRQRRRAGARSLHSSLFFRCVRVYDLGWDLRPSQG